MELTGERRLPAPRDAVWAALNDPDVLKACVPGCESFEREGDDAFTAVAKAKIGPVSAKFTGKVTLTDIDPPNGYTLNGEGQGGAAGFAKGSAKVALEEDGAETILRYDADAQIGGKLAQIGSRLVKSTADQYATKFFDAFAAEISRRENGEEDGAAETQPPTATSEAPRSGPPKWVWIAAVVAAAVVAAALIGA